MDASPQPQPTPAKAAPAPFVPVIPAPLPQLGDRVRFVLRPLGAGIKHAPKVRAATVVEDWSGREKHPTGQVKGPDGKVIVGEDGKPLFPPGCVNLEIHLDGHARKDHTDGHVLYEGDVLYDPKKGHRTWHWTGD